MKDLKKICQLWMICGFLNVVNNTIQEGQLNTLLTYKADGIDNRQVHANCIPLSIGHKECWLASDQHNQLFPRTPFPFCLHIKYKNRGMNPVRSYFQLTRGKLEIN